jgi:hypothetical protein
MDEGAIDVLTRRQAGLIARFQVLALGGSDPDIARLLRRRLLNRVHTGVYVNHTGPLTWEQRAWAAVLAVFPAALGGSSALRAHRVRGHDDDNPVQVVVAEDRRVHAPRGVRVRRVAAYDELVQAHLSPPRMRLEHAALDVASRAATDDAAVSVLADICQTGRSTPQRLRDALMARPTLPRRRILMEILDDVASGAYSALERRYLVRVERRHGLPSGIDNGGSLSAGGSTSAMSSTSARTLSSNWTDDWATRAPTVDGATSSAIFQPRSPAI